MTDKIVKSFESLKDRKVEATVSTKSTMMKVFKAFPETSFTQADFVERLGKLNPHVNRILHELMEVGFITREGSNRKYYYKLAKA